jgi:hypothetical protein
MENEINFDNEIQSNELSLNDFKGGNFLKNPLVGETIILDIVSIQRNENTKGKNKESGAEFVIGVKQKDGVVKRFDIHCVGGIYTISNWEIYFKLLGGNGLLIKYAKEHNGSFAGAKISIKKLLDGGHMSTKIPDLAKILGVSVPEATEYQAQIKQAIKEQRLYEVKLL